MKGVGLKMLRWARSWHYKLDSRAPESNQSLLIRKSAVVRTTRRE
jgi:hypothetical protein